MDGYLDVTDARHSYGEREKKLAILKDPHTGAFAIIGLGLYLLLYAGAVSELVGADVWLLPGALMLERACSGYSVVAFPKAKKDGLAAEFSRKCRDKGCSREYGGFSSVGDQLDDLLGTSARRLAALTALATFVCYYRFPCGNLAASTAIWQGIFCRAASGMWCWCWRRCGWQVRACDF